MFGDLDALDKQPLELFWVQASLPSSNGRYPCVCARIAGDILSVREAYDDDRTEATAARRGRIRPCEKVEDGPHAVVDPLIALGRFSHRRPGAHRGEEVRET